jgi:putative hydrolase of the HAD superfamily
MEDTTRRKQPVIRAVLFDLDGTLYSRDDAIVRMAEVQFATFRDQFAHVTQAHFIERLVALDNHGHGRIPQLHHRLAAELGFSEHVADQLEACFRANYPQCCQISADTVPTLLTLRSRGFKVGMITNGPTLWQSRKIDALGIAPLFDAILISGNEGVDKPDPRIFHRALDRCGVVAAESMFVGDHPQADIRGAREAGMIPVWMKMPYWEVAPDVARIEKIGDVLKLILEYEIG